MASVIVLSFWKMYSETNILIEGPVVYENQSSCGQKSHAFDSEKVGRYICIHPLKELEQSAFLFHHKRQHDIYIFCLFIYPPADKQCKKESEYPLF